MYRVTVTYAGLEGMPAVNTLHFAGNGATGATGAIQKVNAFVSAIKPYVVSAVTISAGTVVEEINPATGELIAFYGVSGASATGTDANNPLPIGTSLTVALQTNTIIRGKRVQGRIYIPGMSEGLPIPAQGTLSSQSVATLSAAVADSLGSGAGPVFCVWSRPTDNQAGNDCPITTIAARRVLTSLRSRRR